MSRSLVGERFGKLEVVCAIGKYRRATMWQCRCDCGRLTAVRHDHLCAGLIKSCRCGRAEQTAKRNWRHGGRDLPEYEIWAGMISRCTNSREKNFKYYGGRGITVCPEWKASFPKFLENMGPRPGADYSLERKKNDEDYCRENCKWATRQEQGNNRRNNRSVTILGRTMNAEQWKRELKLKPSQITAAGLVAVAAYCAAAPGIAL